MTYFDAIILGLIQGLTEFIPVSSSGHLVLAREVFGIEGGGLFFDVVLHLGTLLAVLIYFRKDIFQILATLKTDRKLLWMIIAGTVPTVFAGFFFAKYVVLLGESGVFAAAMLIVTATFFLIAEKILSLKKTSDIRSFKDLSLKDAIIIGCMQVCALLPGVSRSGTTIATAVMRGIDRQSAARFSFLLSIPVIAGAGVYTAIDALEQNVFVLNGYVAAGFVVSFISGFLAIAFLIKFLEKNTLAWFAGYLFIVGIGLLVYFNV